MRDKYTIEIFNDKKLRWQEFRRIGAFESVKEAHDAIKSNKEFQDRKYKGWRIVIGGRHKEISRVIKEPRFEYFKRVYGSLIYKDKEYARLGYIIPSGKDECEVEAMDREEKIWLFKLPYKIDEDGCNVSDSKNPIHAEFIENYDTRLYYSD